MSDIFKGLEKYMVSSKWIKHISWDNCEITYKDENKMRIIVAGGRDYEPTDRARYWLSSQLVMLDAAIVISGGASGADKFGEEVAKELSLPTKIFEADWHNLGRAAGPMRNDLMAQNADAVILFPGGKGTASMERIAMKYGLLVTKYRED